MPYAGASAPSAVHDGRERAGFAAAKRTPNSFLKSSRSTNKWGLVTVNPVTASEPSVPKKRRGIALTPVQQQLVLESASGPWCLSMFLEMCAATGARRGEVLALRWADLQNGRAVIARSLTQTKQPRAPRPLALLANHGKCVGPEAEKARRGRSRAGGSEGVDATW